jgi:hypothetical protein
MSSRFQKNKRDPESIAIPTGYEGNNTTEDYYIPSCGLEDLDRAIFNLFDKDIPLFYMHANQQRKVPVIFATGERFAILRRKEPLTDKNNAIILPLISIIRNAVENKPQKGMANNMMFPSVIAKRIAGEDTDWKQISNKENLLNSLYSPAKKTEVAGDLSLQPKLSNNIVEVIEIPPPRYFGASYEVTIWSSFTQQMNAIMETIMSAYTLHPGQQFRVESDKGYWFPAFIDSSISQDASYQDFSDQERFVKYSFNITATGYIVAPDIMGGKTALRSFKSAPQISFEIGATQDSISKEPRKSGIVSNDVNAFLLNEFEHEDDLLPTDNVGMDAERNVARIQNRDPLAQVAASDARNFANGTETRENKPDIVGARGSDYQKSKQVEIRNAEGEIIRLQAKNVTETKGEAVFAGGIAEIIDIINN